ncbi:hypothetical protein [Jeotgalibacillus proteolyticus]|uniref:Uncharacterized protein n=1 Tax=Jeotgalibacillus proteolyticus TaxID=2082395 RepID=A0A2S5GHC9_9BACL|nr:hypothetical protein [Jeotgalibacillus proteolyticus]PPA72457.1 hypothetical protein C4B60_03530 [Jeotgalibacillus proteolyticus]
MKTSTTLKWITGGLEAFFAIPVLGGIVIVSFSWTPLWIMLGLHIVTLVFAAREFEGRSGSILGIVTSVLGFIPFLGFALHVATSIVLLLDAARTTAREKEYY